jgi:cell division transport system permease protein
MPSKKITKEEQKATERLSKERLERIAKTRRHHLRTNARVIKYGAKSFVRNTWLSVAAIAIMAVTLIVLSATIIATHAMGTAINIVEQQVDMSVYIKQGTTQEQIDDIAKRMAQLSTVVEVSSTSPSDAYEATVEKIISRNSNGMSEEKKTAYRKSLLEAPNQLPWTLNIKLINLNNTQELEQFVQNDESIKDLVDEGRPPSYASSRRGTIDNIANLMNRIELIGLVAAGVFALIAILVVFNTIRMAIYNRKEEIYMMRLVGASRWFIVGPFVIEASFYGIVAAVIAGVVAYGGAFALRSQFGATLDPTLDIMRNYWYLAACALLVAGILIGVLSSLLATRKYLKQK